MVDVRTVPRSRHNPQYNQDVLGTELAPWQIAYDRIAGLGGLRSRARDVPPDVNGYWINQSFHNYADYALSPAFGEALDQLIATAAETPTAIMCSEAVWWRCHRRIITDYLLAAGETVYHILAPGKIEAARMNEAARPQGAGVLTYPAPRPEQRDLFSR